MPDKFHLISSLTCPWVQRAVITLRAKAVDFEITYINLREKPDWFLRMSPHGKVPVLLVGDQPLFESNAIAEYLDETLEPRLHPADPVKRARNRAWTDFIPDFARALNSINYAKTTMEAAEAATSASTRIARLENALASERGDGGPYFNGDSLCLVDAGYAPFFQRFSITESVLRTGLLKQFPLVQAWSDALLANKTIVGSVADRFVKEYTANLARRGACAAKILSAAEVAE